MLVEFSVTNFRSLRDRQTFSLVKGRGDELLGSNTFPSGPLRKTSLLRSAAIYGPNAGGKSNFLLALKTMKEIVVESATDLQRGDKLPVSPFQLSKATRYAPSEFEVIFIVDGVRYEYGFATTETRVHEEWLLAYPKGRPQQWYERVWNRSKKSYDWVLGNPLTGEKRLWQKSTRDNALFLSTAVQLNSEQLQPIYDWFLRTLRTVRKVNAVGWNPYFSASLYEDDKGGKTRILDFLRAADLGIQDILVENKPIDATMLPEDIPDSLRKKFKGIRYFEITTSHKDSEGKSVNFDISEESDGTRKLFSFSGPWIDCLANGYVLFIDELHDNLHPRLVQFLVQLFHSNETNQKNAQLVFSSHETSILDQANIFRRDQIWFCEKDENSATKLYPLTDFSPRKGRENLELAYLAGRYGAIPHVLPLGKQSVNG